MSSCLWAPTSVKRRCSVATTALGLLPIGSEVKWILSGLRPSLSVSAVLCVSVSLLLVSPARFSRVLQAGERKGYDYLCVFFPRWCLGLGQQVVVHNTQHTTQHPPKEGKSVRTNPYTKSVHQIGAQNIFFRPGCDRLSPHSPLVSIVQLDYV